MDLCAIMQQVMHMFVLVGIHVEVPLPVVLKSWVLNLEVQ